MSSVADAIFSHKSNPTGEELRHVAQEMAKKWPFLAMANADYVSWNRVIEYCLSV